MHQNQSGKYGTRHIVGVWRWLTKPSNAIEDVALRRKSQLLTTILPITTMLFLGVDMALWLTMPNYVFPWPGYMLLITAYILNRVNYYKWAVVLTLTVFPVVLFSLVINNNTNNPSAVLCCLILSVLLASMLLSIKGTVIVALINIIGILLLPLLAPNANITFNIIVPPLAVIVIGSVLAISSTYNRNQIEADRQAQLSNNEDKYRSIFENATEGIFRSTPQGRFTQVNAALVKLLGYQSIDEVLALKLPDDLYVNKKDRIQLKELGAIQGDVRNFETVWRRKDGSNIIVNLNGRNVRDKDEQVLYYEGIVQDITQRKQAEDALCESQEKYSNLFEYGSDAIFIESLNGDILDVNEKACQLLGYAKEELLLLKVSDLIPSRRPEEAKNIKSTLKKGEPLLFEGKNRRKNGSLVDVEVSIRMIDFRGEKIAQVFTRDITERKQMEKALLESEKRLRNLLETVQLISVLLDTQGNVTFCNNYLLNLTGYEKGEVIGYNWFDMFIQENERKTIKQGFLQNVKKHTVTPHGENYIVTRLGERRMISWNNTLLHNLQGEVTGTASIGIDITERKQFEEALLQSELKYRTLFGTSTDAIFLERVDNGEVLDCNDLACELYGYPRDEMIGLLVGDLVPNEVVENQLAAIDYQKMEAEGLLLEALGKRKDGTIFPTEVSINIANAGNEKLMVAYVRDITQRKQAEQSLQAYAAELERSNKELQNFAYVASHDLQEPLRKIQTFGNRLNTKYNDKLDDQALDYLMRMQNAAARMQTLIKDLLIFSRVTTKAAPFSVINLNDVIKGVLLDLEVTSESTNAKIELAKLPSIEADQTQMRQLFQNLISNALKFCKEEEVPVVSIKSKVFNPKGQDGTYCEIYVQDSGIGFDEKYLERIFNVFQRLHGRNIYPGTGVGLAVCKKIVERHNGTITATSKPGRGATFIVTLPVEQS